jgi:hypothetical protein
LPFKFIDVLPLKLNAAATILAKLCSLIILAIVSYLFVR